MEQHNYTLNIDKCIADRSIPAAIRTLFIDLRENGYVTVGDYLSSLADADLDILRGMAEIVAEGKDLETKRVDDAHGHMVLLSVGLIIAEGGEVDPEELDIMVKMTMTFITLEYLGRNGAIDVFRENWCMDPDSKGIIAKAKEVK